MVSGHVAVAVGALLENEAIAGLSTGKQSVLRRTSSSPADSTVWTPEALIKIVSQHFTRRIGMLFCELGNNVLKLIII
jgi:hypothetical protein